MLVAGSFKEPDHDRLHVIGVFGVFGMVMSHLVSAARPILLFLDDVIMSSLSFCESDGLPDVTFRFHSAEIVQPVVYAHLISCMASNC